MAGANDVEANRKLTNAVVKDYQEVKANGEDGVAMSPKVQNEAVDMACEQCCRFFYEWNDEEDSNKDMDEWNADVVKKGNANKKT